MAATERSVCLLPTSSTRRISRDTHCRRSAQSVAVSMTSRLLIKNAIRTWALQPNRRWPFAAVDGLMGMLPKYHPLARIERVELDECPGEWVRAKGASTKRAILYLHGGAFMTCGLNTHRALVARLSRTADACVLNVGYRLLPAHRIADAVDDAISGLRWLQRRGYRDDQIVIAGDSAGGYLAFMTALSAVRTDIAKPAGIAAISPLTDTDPSAKIKHRNASKCSMFTRRAFSSFAKYLDESQQQARQLGFSGRVESPVDADLSTMPPVTIHASTDELLLPDAELMAERLGESGVRCDLHLRNGQIHDFPLAADVLPEGRRALHYIGEFVKEVTTAGASKAEVPAERPAGHAYRF